MFRIHPSALVPAEDFAAWEDDLDRKNTFRALSAEYEREQKVREVTDV